MKEIFLAQDFSRHPAGRYKSDGPYSGELFREQHLVPAILEREPTTIHLDGARGYGSSFLEEAFGGLARMYSTEQVRKYIRLQSRDGNLIDRIISYIEDASSKKAKRKNMLFGI